MKRRADTSSPTTSATFLRFADPTLALRLQLSTQRAAKQRRWGAMAIARTRRLVVALFYAARPI
jgi:hypothetical protein